MMNLDEPKRCKLIIFKEIRSERNYEISISDFSLMILNHLATCRKK